MVVNVSGREIVGYCAGRPDRWTKFGNPARFVQLASPDLPTVNPGTDAIRAIGLSDLPYEQEISWDTTYDDVVLVDQRTSTRRKILEHYHGSEAVGRFAIASNVGQAMGLLSASFVRSSSKRPRSSARSIASAVVPY